MGKILSHTQYLSTTEEKVSAYFYTENRVYNFNQFQTASER